MGFSKKDVNMLSGSITGGLLKIAIPIMVMNVIQSLFNIIDMTILKMFDTGDGYAVGAVGACGTLIGLITGLLIGVSTGANVIIARYIGRADEERVDRAIGTAMLFSVVGGLALMIIGTSCAGLFLDWVNCPEELLEGATLYFKLYFAGVPILMIYNFCASILRSSGDSRRPMIYLTVGGIIKVGLTYLFVGVFEMNIKGVACTTIISWTITAVLGTVTLLINRGAVKLKLRYVRFYKAELKEILFIGVPAGLQQAIYSVANVIIAATVNSFGPDATTGIAIANNFDGILYQVAVATSIAVMPYVSQNVGNGNIKRAKLSVLKGILITIPLSGFFGALSAIFSPQLASIMSDNPVVIDYACQKMVIISSTYFICGVSDIMSAALRGMGRPIVSTVSTLIFMCALRFLWVYAIFPLHKNLTFLYLVWPIGWTLSIITLTFFFFPTAKRLSERLEKSKECENAELAKSEC